MRICILFILLVLSSTQYVSGQCATTYSPTNDCSVGDRIDYIEIGGTGASDFGCGTSGYGYYPSPVFTLQPGLTYTWTAIVGNNTYPQNVSIWIDFNNDAMYDPSEMVGQTTVAGYTLNSTLFIPTSASLTTVKMRVRCAYNVSLGGGDACTDGFSGWGETEDFDVIITCNYPIIPTLSFVAQPSVICSGETATLEASGATNYTWSGGITNGVPFAPASSANYSLFAKLGYCPGNTVTSSYSITVNPSTTVGIAASSGTMCANQSVTLTGNGATSYQWSTGSTASSIVVSPAASTSYTLVGNNVHNCPSLAKQTVLVGQLPVLSGVTTDTAVCPGTPVTLTAVSPSAMIEWYAVANGGSALSSTISGGNYTVSPSTTTTYYADAISNSYTITETFTYTGGYEAFVVPATVGQITVDISGAQGGASGGLGGRVQAEIPVTPGDVLYLFAGGQGGGFASSSPGGFNGGGNAGVANAINTSAAGGGGASDIRLNGISLSDRIIVAGGGGGNAPQNGPGGHGGGLVGGSQPSTGNTCIGTFATGGTQSAGGNPSTWSGSCCDFTPVPGGSLGQGGDGAGPSPSCNNGDAGAGGGGGYYGGGGGGTYTGGGGGSSFTAPGSNNVVHTQGYRSGDGVISITYQLMGGCAAAARTPVTITINPIPSVSGMAISPAVCFGGTTALNGSGASTYTWTGGVTDGVPFSPAATADYTVSGTSTAGCTSTNNAVVSVTVHTLPVVSIAGANAICAGDAVTLTASGASTYSWSTSALTQQFIDAPSSTTSYSVTGTDINGCENTASHGVTVFMLPVLTAAPGAMSLCIGSTVTANVSGAMAYSWAPGTDLSSTSGSTVTVLGGSDITYTITGTDSNGCTDTETLSVTAYSLPVVSITPTLPVCAFTTLTLSAAGADTYTWNTGPATSSVIITPTITGIYSVTGTSTLTACENTAAITLTVEPLPTVVISGSAAICAGGSTTLSASGASTYSWSNTSTTQSISVSPAASTLYSVTGISAAGCTNTSAVTVTVNALPLLTTGPGTSTSVCTNQTAALTVSGASAYSWSPGSGLSATTGSNVTATAGLSDVVYTITGTDNNGCVSATSYSLNFLSLPVVAITPTNPVCANTNLTLTASGASTYTWNTTAVSPTIGITPASTTIYSVIGTAANTCTGSALLNLTVFPLPSVIISGSIVLCAGDATTLTASGASTYLWNNSAVSSTIAVSPGTTTSYSVTGTSAQGCTNTAQETVTVNPLPVISTAPGSSTAVCTNLSASLQVSGANTYTWNPATGLSAGNGSVVTATAGTNNVTYTITGTDLNGCRSSASYSFNFLALPTVVITPTTAICANDNITLTASGAGTYTWNTTAISNTIADAPAVTTTYSVLATAANGCENTASLSLLVHPLPVVTANSATTAVCAGGSVTLYGSGASTYTWSGGITDNVSFAPSGTGIYTVTGTSTANCVSSNAATISITVNPLPVLVTAATPTAICIGQSADISVSGASTYTWNNNQNTSTISVNPVSGTNYSVTGMSAAGCTGTATQSLVVHQLPVITIAGSNTVICIGQTITYTASGANTYTWTTNSVTPNILVSPATSTVYTVTGTSTANCTSSASIGASVNPLPVVAATVSSGTVCAGTSVVFTGSGANTYTWTGGPADNQPFVPTASGNFSVSGTSLAGCISTNVAFASVLVNPLPAVVANTSSSVICSGQNTTLFGSGAATYVWTGGVTDNIAFSPIQTDSYTVTGTDANNCQNTATITVTVNPLPVVTASATSYFICDGNTVIATGGGASSYTWTGGISDGVAFSPSLTASYSVTGTNPANCTSTNNAVITITVNPIPVVTATVSDNVICAGDSVIFTAAGANTYTWSGGVTDGVHFKPLSSQSFSVQGTSTAMCTSTNNAVVNITVNALPVVTGNAALADVCIGGTTALSGSGASSYTWTGGVSDNVAFSPTVSATYSVTGVDVNGCSADNSVHITVHALPTITAVSSKSVVCFGDTLVFTGNGANSYTWTGGVTNGVSFTATSSGGFSVTGSSTAGCTSANIPVVSITVNPLPNVLITSNTTSICPGGTVVLNASGAGTYSWVPSVLPGAEFTPSTTTTYTATGTDSNTCSNSSTVQIVVHAAPQLTITPSKLSSCEAESVTLAVNGAASYSWSSGSADSLYIITPTITTNYTVTGRSNEGCIASLPYTQTVTVCDGTMNAVASITNISCYGKQDGRIAITSIIPHAQKELKYIWTPDTLCPGNNCDTLGRLHPGNYSVKLLVTYTVNGSLVKRDSITIASMQVLDLNGPCELKIYNGVSPNGDGVNEKWTIDNITDFPKNKVSIFNRWGEQIFTTTGYNNTSRVWPQENDKPKLVSSTYFYVIELGDGSSPLKGWIELVKD